MARAPRPARACQTHAQSPPRSVRPCHSPKCPGCVHADWCPGRSWAVCWL